MRKFNTIDGKDIEAANAVVSGAARGFSPLSGYVGSSAIGGPRVTDLEQMWQETFGVRHAVAVNSATSGLLAACMAIGLDPKDEVIVSPYTMSATAAAPKVLGAKIVFADIERDTFCLDPAEVKKAITPNTKAVIVTNLFGHPAKLHELRTICDEEDIYLIEDNAQAIFAKEGTKYTGTIGDMGVFSLNVHKQIQTGEGGVVVTDDAWLAERLRCAMNHGEMRGGILGLNLRMTEVTAAMAAIQLQKAPKVLDDIRSYAEGISHYVKQLGLPIRPPIVRSDCVHSYYCWAGLAEETFEAAPPFRNGYMQPIYELPAFAMKGRLQCVESVEGRMILLELCGLSNPELDIKTIVENLGRGL